MKLLSGEERKTELTNVTVTNYRILQNSGGANKISIFLENISSVELHFKSNLWSLFLALVIPIAVFVFQKEYFVWSLVAGGVCVLYYFLSRTHVLGICSNGGSTIEILIKGKSSSKIEDFIAALDTAKLARVNELFKNN